MMAIGARRHMRLALAALAGALLAGAYVAPAVGAQEGATDALCPGVAEGIDLSGLLPGAPRTVDLDVCNDSASAAHFVLAAPSAGDLGPLVDVTIEDHWTGTLDQLSQPVTVDDGVLGPGERRSYELTVGLSRRADNRSANRAFSMQFVLVRSTAVLDDVVVRPGETADDGEPTLRVTSRGAVDGPLPHTGADALRIAAVALVAIVAGMWLRTYAGRRS
ncbi:hypothetical protein NHL50_07245 [Acidimicrobiia bacterium EGI L10123]|uniref:hypothetical protein n=1 Tax=Salinilacustrithrix flava TaxID=2957203 RepID=UPI003D7C2FD1|nr:hypothetical protein [Acidimicrobiia bacterium EGI L10123]